MPQKNNRPKINKLDPYPTLESVPLAFSIRCCNLKKDYSYNLETLPIYYREITRAFAWSILTARNSVGHFSREKSLGTIRKLYKYFNALPRDARPVHPSQIDTSLLREYARWLKDRQKGAYSSKALIFRTLGPLIKRWIGRPWAAPNLSFPKSMFPKSHRTKSPVQTFTDAEFEQIVKAVHQDLEELAAKFERPYVPKYLNKPAPLDDVAPC